MALVLGIVLPSIIFYYVDIRWNKEFHDPVQQTQSSEALSEPYEIDVGLLLSDGTVKTLSLEEYLVSVVLREMPASFDKEALKAQAVVARTYTLRRIKTGGKHSNSDVCADSACCQGYYDPGDYLSDGGKQELLEKVISAVQSTAGEVLVYDGSLIDATYFSCSGGKTEDALAVWGSDIPYLQSTDSPGEEGASHYTDTVSFSLSEFAEKLDLDISAQQNDWLGDIQYTNGGGVATIQIYGKTFEGTEIRKALGLRSTAFIISLVGNSVTITTKGFGHRVGMSQYGADAMAAQGKTYEQILLHYYQGTELIPYAE